MPKPIPRLPPVISATRFEVEGMETIVSQVADQKKCGTARSRLVARRTRRPLSYDSRPTCWILRTEPCGRAAHSPSRWADGIRNGARGLRDRAAETDRVRRAEFAR